jgi:hypothetical protein
MYSSILSRLNYRPSPTSASVVEEVTQLYDEERNERMRDSLIPITQPSSRASTARPRTSRHAI